MRKTQAHQSVRNKTQAGNRDDERENHSAFMPLECKIATLIMKRIFDIVDTLPQPQDLFFSLLAALTAKWVITFIAPLGDYDSTVFGLLYGGAQVTAFSSFWYVVLNVLWLRATPRGYMGHRIRQILDDIDCELTHCKLNEADKGFSHRGTMRRDKNAGAWYSQRAGIE